MTIAHTPALPCLCSPLTSLHVKSPDFLKPLVLINPKSQQELNMLGLFTAHADRFDRQH